ncbi:sulfate permease [Sulfurimonas gotlandica GD1]|uniref:Sulfate permease n=1 Tax=Sulfurimonas gotlandica (strain DSM 19862 / JCM 16533 / GD1) TaxID=929558 RepID=B6BMJ4_SULGG|nr:SulP family inorganic anion transporter [Sulfurimonas gotlandica]EDZ61672.1 sulfate permease family protein [Sulfurimonas gotlandica GD1]EHP30891.1 sulfate permease [Sulfurimonas gotlandica GD1]
MNLKQNLFGGITAAVIALPLGLAFGVASGMGAAAGIFGAIILGFFASLFGGTPSQISGPTGPMTVVVAAAVISLNSDIGLIVTTILLAGIFQIIFGISKIGKFVQYIPYPVISGFMSGIGVIIIILQINPFLGLTSDASIVHILITLPSNITDANLSAAIIATATIIIMFFSPSKISNIIPAPLIALSILTPISIYLNLSIATIGEIPATLPSFVMPTLSLEHYTTVISLAFTLAVLGMIDTLLTSIVADSITGTKHKPDRELIGQGIGNSICALTGSLPGAGATMRTVINIKSGGTHKISGITHSLILLLTVLFLAPLASKIPLAILAGILIKVGVDILDYKFLSIWKDSPKNDLSVMLVVFLITVFIDLITAVGVGIVLASLLIVYRITKEAKITLVDSQHEDADIQFNLMEKKVRVIKINGAFFFGSSTAFERETNSILDTKIVIIDILDVPFMDITAIFTLKDLISKLQIDNIEVIILAQEKDKTQLLKLNKTRIFDNVKFYDDMNSAVKNI